MFASFYVLYSISYCLYYTILYYTILYYTILYYTILHDATRCYTNTVYNLLFTNTPAHPGALQFTIH